MLQLVFVICRAVILLGTHYVVGQDQNCSCTSCDWSNHFVTNGSIIQENIAIGKKTIMSQAWKYSGPACLAVDGKTDRNFQYNPNPNCISTAEAVGNHYWQVDLGDWVIVENISIFTVQSYETQMHNVNITVDGQHCYTFPASGNIREVENITCRQARIGRVIKFSTVSEATSTFIGFCEIQVWRRFCSCIPQGCDFSNHCVPAGNCKKVNVALGMTANMSQEWRNSGPACLAVDGKTDGKYRENPNPNCIATANNINNPFWQVDLCQQFKVKYITVYTMESYANQMHNVKITVDNQDCYTFGSSNINLVENVTCHQARTGRYVKFNNTSSYLAFCEVQVWICIDRTYGKDCAQSCGHCLDSEQCDIETGECDSCEHGFSPPLCQSACNNGTYGQNCSQLCGNCNNNVQCDPANGMCTSCSPGFIPPLCQSPCNDKTYGPNCLLLCGNCAGNMSCDPVNGVCTSCAPGFIPPLCQSPCNNGTYGDGCLYFCGNCTNNDPCDTVNGICTSCSPGFYPPLCQSPCSNRTYGLNCSIVCGNCMDGEQCDPVNGLCRSCALGFFPPRCQLPCSGTTYDQNCPVPCGKCTDDAPCDKVNGTCNSCKPGYLPPMCHLSCTQHTYGQNCSFSCGECTDDAACEKVNGTCTSCKPGYVYPLCQKLSAAQEGNDHIGAVIGAILGAGLLIASAILIAVFVWLRNSKRAKESDVSNQSKAHYNENIQNVNLCAKTESENDYEELHTSEHSLNEDIAIPEDRKRVQISTSQTYEIKSTSPENQYDKLSQQYVNIAEDLKPYDEL